MRRVFLFLALLMVSSISFAQEEIKSDAQPKKFASWTISNAFQAEARFAGSYWKPTFNIAVDKDGYYCVVNMYASDGYYSVNTDALPHLYLKTEDGQVVDLEMDGDEPIHKSYLKGYYSGKVWMPGRYVTRFIYVIPDITTFLSKYYVKYRVWLGEGFKDVDLGKSYSKKFNQRLKTAYREATNEFKTKQHTLENPLEGF